MASSSFRWCFALIILTFVCITAKHHSYHQSRHQNLVISKDYDCAIRELALQYAQYIRPDLASYRSIFDGLELGTICGQTPPSPVETMQDRMERVKTTITMEQLDSVPSIYVSPFGSDSNSGTINAPLLTIHAALLRTRAARDDASQYMSVLRAGTYELKQSIKLGYLDSGLVITSYPGESVIISGGRTLSNLNWKSMNGSSIVVTQLPSDIVLDSEHLNQMWINGKRQIRARYPNADPEVTGLYTTPTGYVSSATGWLSPKSYPPATEVHVSSPSHDGTFFPEYQMGIGGVATVFTPPRSFWATASPPGGGGSTYLVPSGLTYNDSTFSPHVKSWSRPTTGIVHAFHNGHWGNWMFTIDSLDTSHDTIHFGRGGVQEARGSWSGAEFYVENIFEELDSPAEWFVDDQTGLLYYYVNTTDQSPPTEITISQIPYLITIDGTSDNPAKYIHISGLTFAYTSQTFMKEYAVPSGGDWSIHLGAAIMARGVEDLMIVSNLFEGIGGNTILLHGYSRGAYIGFNEILLSGDSGIALIGEFQGIEVVDGNQPFDTTILYNLIHEVGIWGKQVSPIIQAVTAKTTILGNILFNMPRAGINFNDGFGGGSLVKNNLIFNTVRETADHGPFNSWDRLPFLTNTNGLGLIPLPNHITQNFFINNYHAVWPIDHDDGSCYYIDGYNFMAYGGFKNFLGHNRTVTYNIYLFPDSKRSSRLSDNTIHPLDRAHVKEEMIDQWGGYFIEPFCAQGSSSRLGSSGYGDFWQNNTCTLSDSNVVYDWDDMSIDPKTGLTNLVPESNYNQFWMNPNTPPVVNVAGNYLNFTAYQSSPINFDTHSTFNGLATIKQIQDWGKALLFHEMHDDKQDGHGHKHGHKHGDGHKHGHKHGRKN